MMKNRNNPLPYFLIPQVSIKTDPELNAGGCGDRKLAVSQLYPDIEIPQRNAVWKAPVSGELQEVLITDNLEIAIFSEKCPQIRHYHEVGTEIYEVLEGKMNIIVEEEEVSMQVSDMLVLQPGTIHLIPNGQTAFIARVLLVNSGGPNDKVVVN